MSAMVPKQGSAYQVDDWPNETNERGNMIGCLFNGPRSWGIPKVVQALEAASGLRQCDSCFKDIAI
jgi:hypothetical protein